jgi:hypothetical protein
MAVAKKKQWSRGTGHRLLVTGPLLHVQQKGLAIVGTQSIVSEGQPVYFLPVSAVDMF